LSEQGKFASRWQELALTETMQLAADATITARTLAAQKAPSGLEQTMAQEAGAPEPAKRQGSLPRISLAHAPTPHAASVSDQEEPDLKLDRLLGEGGMGRVHLAQQRSLGREVAVKTLKEQAEQAAHHALISEARVTSCLAHPGIIPVHSLGLDGSDRPVLVMKRIEGVPWRDLIHDPDNPAWSYWDSRSQDRLLAHLEILTQVCDAVHFAHSQGVIHRDIKPENVMLGRFGEVYLVDWGLATRLGEDVIGQLVGTPAYMAPEMVMGEAVDERTDVYLLGATLHEILTGRCKHSGSNFHKLLAAAFESAAADFGAEIPEGLASLCNRSTAKLPSERPQSADEFRQAISDYRRQRTSLSLSDAAEARLLLAEEPRSNDALEPRELAFQISTLAAEARFGFEQALEAWPDNQKAAEGLQSCLALLVEAHIMRRDPFAARAQLDAMEDAAVSLTSALRQLEQELKEEEREQERLKRMDEELDDSVGEAARAFAYVIVCIISIGISGYLLVTGKDDKIGYGTTVGILALVFVTTLVTVVVKRKQLLSNAFNRRCVALVFVMIGLVLINRLLCWNLRTPLQQLFATDLLLMAACSAAAAINLLRWMSWMSACFAIGAGCTVLLPVPAPVSFSVAVMSSLLVGFIAWRFASRVE
jgi:serine/threonine-protein kinase